VTIGRPDYTVNFGGAWDEETGPRSCGVSLGGCEGEEEEIPTGSCGVKVGILGDF